MWHFSSVPWKYYIDCYYTGTGSIQGMHRCVLSLNRCQQIGEISRELLKDNLDQPNRIWDFLIDKVLERGRVQEVPEGSPKTLGIGSLADYLVWSERDEGTMITVHEYEKLIIWTVSKRRK